HREVLREHEDRPAVDASMAGDDTVAGHALRLHAEVVRPVDDESVQLLERAGIEQRVDALAGRQLPGGVLLGDALFAAAEAALGVAPPQLLQSLVPHGRISLLPPRASPSRRGT